MFSRNRTAPAPPPANGPGPSYGAALSALSVPSANLRRLRSAADTAAPGSENIAAAAPPSYASSQKPPRTARSMLEDVSAGRRSPLRPTSAAPLPPPTTAAAASVPAHLKMTPSASSSRLRAARASGMDTSTRSAVSVARTPAPAVHASHFTAGAAVAAATAAGSAPATRQSTLLASRRFFLAMESDSEKSTFTDGINRLGGVVEGFFSRRVTDLVVEDAIKKQTATLIRQANDPTTSSLRTLGPSRTAPLSVAQKPQAARKTMLANMLQSAAQAQMRIWDMTTLRRELKCGIEHQLSNANSTRSGGVAGRAGTGSSNRTRLKELRAPYFTVLDATGVHRPCILQEYSTATAATLPQLYILDEVTQSPFIPADDAATGVEALIPAPTPLHPMSRMFSDPNPPHFNKDGRIFFGADGQSSPGGASGSNSNDDSDSLPRDLETLARDRKLASSLAAWASARPGYCEWCRAKFNNMGEHVRSAEHRAGVTSVNAWNEFDKHLKLYQREKATRSFSEVVIIDDSDGPIHEIDFADGALGDGFTANHAAEPTMGQDSRHPRPSSRSRLQQQRGEMFYSSESDTLSDAGDTSATQAGTESPLANRTLQHSNSVSVMALTRSPAILSIKPLPPPVAPAATATVQSTLSASNLRPPHLTPSYSNLGSAGPAAFATPATLFPPPPMLSTTSRGYHHPSTCLPFIPVSGYTPGIGLHESFGASSLSAATPLGLFRSRSKRSAPAALSVAVAAANQALQAAPRHEAVLISPTTAEAAAAACTEVGHSEGLDPPLWDGLANTGVDEFTPAIARGGGARAVRMYPPSFKSPLQSTDMSNRVHPSSAADVAFLLDAIEDHDDEDFAGGDEDDDGFDPPPVPSERDAIPLDGSVAYVGQVPTEPPTEPAGANSHLTSPNGAAPSRLVERTPRIHNTSEADPGSPLAGINTKRVPASMRLVSKRSHWTMQQLHKTTTHTALQGTSAAVTATAAVAAVEAPVSVPRVPGQDVLTRPRTVSYQSGRGTDPRQFYATPADSGSRVLLDGKPRPHPLSSEDMWKGWDENDPTVAPTAMVSAVPSGATASVTAVAGAAPTTTPGGIDSRVSSELSDVASLGESKNDGEGQGDEEDEGAESPTPARKRQRLAVAPIGGGGAVDHHHGTAIKTHRAAAAAAAAAAATILTPRSR